MGYKAIKFGTLLPLSASHGVFLNKGDRCKREITNQQNYKKWLLISNFYFVKN